MRVFLSDSDHVLEVFSILAHVVSCFTRTELCSSLLFWCRNLLVVLVCVVFMNVSSALSDTILSDVAWGRCRNNFWVLALRGLRQKGVSFYFVM